MSAGIIQVAYDCVPASGGIHTSAQDFRSALGADIVSFTSAALLATAPGGAGVHHVRVEGGPLRRSYAWPARSGRDLALAEARVAAASLLVVHGLFRYPAQWARAVARRHRIPYWLVPHGILDPWVFSYRACRKKAWMTLVGRGIVADAARVLHATPQEAAAAAGFIPRSVPTSIIPWPVDLHAAPAGARAAIRSRLGIADAPLLLSLGRLHPSKGIAESICMLGAPGLERLHLALVGPETSELGAAECRVLAERHAPGRVHVMGAVTARERDTWLAAADALLSYSRRENFGYAVAEALAAGLPVIITPQVALASLLRGVECGWVLSERSEPAALAAIGRLLATGPAERAQLGANGRAFVERELSRATFAQRLRELLPREARLPHPATEDAHA